jgi:hypothetical protein
MMISQHMIDAVRRRLEACEKARDLMDMAIDDAHQALRDLELVLQGQGELLPESAAAADGGEAVPPIDDARASRASARPLFHESADEPRR